MSFQGKFFNTEMKQMIVNLKQHFDMEKKAGKFVSTKKSTKRVSLGLGIGEATVKRIMADYNKGKEFNEEKQKERGKPPFMLSENLQPVIREYIRLKNLNGQKISADMILEYLEESYDVQIPKSTFLKSLKRMGFAYGTGKLRSALKEQMYIVLARRQYLRRKIANRTEGRPEVYLDESYINKNHSNKFTWYLEEDGPWVNKPSGKGPRIIILHAITKNGWINGAELTFDAKKRTGDYHGQMNWENFSKWFKTQLLPNIPEKSLIIMDNARYHNVYTDDSFPTQKNKKSELCAWLDRNQIPWTKDMLKPELYELCKKLSPAPDFQLDKIAEVSGHSILRTPQYHPELQPIEICWAIVKNYMADNCDFTMSNFRNQIPKAFKKVKPETCKKIIKKVAKQEDKYWAEDMKLYEEIEEDEEVLI